MVDNLAYGGDTALGGKDGCVAHPHLGVSFGSYSSATDFFQSDGTSINYLDYEWENGVGKVDNFGTGRVLRGTFGAGTYGNCALGYDGTTYKAYEVFQSDGYSLASPHEYDTYTEALTAAGNNSDLVRPRGYHYDWVAATQNPTAYRGGTYDETQGPNNGICPEGWRLPTGGTGNEWQRLFIASGGRTTGNGNSTEKQQVQILWKTPTSGYAERGDSSQQYLWRETLWRSASKKSESSAYAFGLAMYDGEVMPNYSANKDAGLSVRCVK